MKFNVYVLLLTIISIFGCREKSSEPLPQLENPEYVWTKDTLSYPGSFQTNMRSMYGTSVNNIYIVGHNDLGKGKMYKYDGKQWLPVPLSLSEGGSIPGGFDLSEIHGSGPEDIWAVGEEIYFDSESMRFTDSSFVIHFNGTQWNKINLPKRRALFCVSAFGLNQMFAGSSDGILYRYDGSNWTLFDLGTQFFFSSISAASINEAYAVGHVEDHALPVDSAGSFLFRFNGATWEKMDSIMRTPGAPSASFGSAVYILNGELYSTNPNVYHRSENQWVKLVDAAVGNLSYDSNKNIIAVGTELVQYNGYDWKKITNISPILGFDCFTDSNQIFIVGNDNYRTIILHGIPK